MREIKFRAWDSRAGKMYEPLTLDYALKSSNNYWGSGNGWPDTTTFLEFTGLKDKNGREIYEGDVVAHLGIKRIVEWDAPQFVLNHSDCRQLELDRNAVDHLEIIGNIHENPELLK